jgi:hypothetical protein
MGSGFRPVSEPPLITASSMSRLTRKGPHHLKFFSLVARAASELYQLANDDMGLYMNWKMHQKGDNVLWKTSLILQRA